MTARTPTFNPEGHTSRVDTFDDGSQMLTETWPGEVRTSWRSDAWATWSAPVVECAA